MKIELEEPGTTAAPVTEGTAAPAAPATPPEPPPAESPEPPATPDPNTPPPAPAAEKPTGGAQQQLLLKDEIAASNDAADARLAKDADDDPSPAPPAAPEPPPAEPKKGDEGEGKPAAELATIDTADTSPIEGTFAFPQDLSLDDFKTRKAEVLEAYEVPQDDAVLSMVEYLEGQLETAKSSVAVPVEVFEDLGGIERVKKTVEPFKALAETKIEGEAGKERVRYNVTPTVEMFRTEWPNEFAPIVAEAMMTDSFKYPGASVFQEILTDLYGASREEILAVDAFLVDKTPLPVKGAGQPMPGDVDESLREAFFSLSEHRRYSIQSLADEIAKLERDKGSLSTYEQGTAQSEIDEKRGQLEGEIEDLKKVQRGLDRDRDEATREARQRDADARAFTGELLKDYYTEIFTIQEGFVKMLAPKLTFLSAETREPFALALAARVANALAFLYDKGTFEYIEDDTADFYAGQLKAEGVRYDFAKGRRILYNHLIALRHVKVLEHTKASPGAVREALAAKDAVVKEIKAATREILGQLTAKFVGSADTALKDKVGEQEKKRQLTRKTIVHGGGGGAEKDTPEKVAADRKAMNARADAALEAGEQNDYSDVLFDRKKAAEGT